MASAVAAVAMFALLVLGWTADGSSPIDEWVVGCFTPGFVLSGWLLVRVDRAPRLGWLYLAAGLTTALAGLAAAFAFAADARGWPGLAWALWVFSWVWQPHMTLAAIGVVLFPTADARSRWSRFFVAAAAACATLWALATVVAPGPIVTTPDHADGRFPNVLNPVGLRGAGGLRTVAAVGSFVVLVVGLVAIGDVCVRYIRSKGVLRGQLRWVAASQLIAVPLGVLVPAQLGGALVPLLAVMQTLVLQMVIVVAVLRWRLYGVNVAVRRSFLAVSLLVAALGVYLTVVGTIAALIGQTGRAVSVVGAVVTAVVFAPVATVIRRWVDTAFYGRRRDPYGIVAVMIRRLSDTTAPDEAVANVAAALRDELRLPFVQIDATSGVVLASLGEDDFDGPVATFDLAHQGQVVGTLCVGARRGETRLSRRDEELLSDLARHVGAAVHASALMTDLRLAHDRLVHTRDNERRRLQRDLHDGLGPRLTAIGMMIDAASNEVTSHPDNARTQLKTARAELTTAVEDIRRLINELDDRTLGSLGLVGALQHQAARLSGGGLTIDVAAESLPPLEAGIEVAAYRIVSEALANVVRHAKARRCSVEIRTDSSLQLRITDDGRGFRPGWRPGVGLRSMEERAVDVGGEFVVTSSPGAGVTIAVSLPLRGADVTTRPSLPAASQTA